jgi:hypothetical protein
MANSGVRVLRYWVFARGDIAPVFDGSTDRCTGLGPNWISHMQSIFDYAKEKGMMIYPSLMSFDWGRGPHTDIFTNDLAQQAFLQNAILPIATAFKDSSSIFAWDLCNEPEWIIRSEDGGEPCSGCTTFSLVQAKSLFSGMITTLRNAGVKQQISIGSACIKWLTERQLWNDLDIDFYDVHWYSWATQYYNLVNIKPSEEISPVKPIIIGEMQPNPLSDSFLQSGNWCDGNKCSDHTKIMYRLRELGYSGYLLWAWTDAGINCQAASVPHLNNFATKFPNPVICDSEENGDNSNSGENLMVNLVFDALTFAVCFW